MSRGTHIKVEIGPFAALRVTVELVGLIVPVRRALALNPARALGAE